MNPERRPNVAKFITNSEVIDIEKGWYETRKALKMGDQYILVEDKWPDWTIADIVDFVRNKPNMELVDLDVLVRPIIGMSDDARF